MSDVVDDLPDHTCSTGRAEVFKRSRFLDFRRDIFTLHIFLAQVFSKTFFSCGEECLDFLYNRGKYKESAKAPWPGILLLDINMPKLDGLNVLKQIRGGEERFHRLPVVALTTSKSEEDRLRGYDLGVNAYIVKPIGFKNFSVAVRTINFFW